jgi:hypothetical protein
MVAEPPVAQPPPEAPPSNGLPRRLPRTNLAPGISDEWPSAGPAGLTRSPEQIRAMLSTYRSGLERGRRVAAGADDDGRAGPAGPQPFDDLDGMGERS